MDTKPHQKRMTSLNEIKIASILGNQLAQAVVNDPNYATLLKLGHTPKDILAQLREHIAPRPLEPDASMKNDDGPDVPLCSESKITSREIREAIICTFADFDLAELCLTSDEHQPIVVEMIERYLPTLNGLVRHKLHRRIIDACARRKHGPVLESRHGKRYIVLR